MEKKKEILRVMDANLNRLREALRVCEEVTRFVVEDKKYTARLKDIRHDVADVVSNATGMEYLSLVRSRDAVGDVGKRSLPQELKRTGPQAILNANLQRAKESARVLEEFSKPIDRKTAESFKKIRFDIYTAEKNLADKVSS